MKRNMILCLAIIITTQYQLVIGFPPWVEQNSIDPELQEDKTLYTDDQRASDLSFLFRDNPEFFNFIEQSYKQRGLERREFIEKMARIFLSIKGMFNKHFDRIANIQKDENTKDQSGESEETRENENPPTFPSDNSEWYINDESMKNNTLYKKAAEKKDKISMKISEVNM